ncbi:hypothetical protein ES703_43263 [subsurface metagenome]
MGLKIEPPVAGDGCWCHPLPDDTPMKIYVIFTGLKQCPARDIPPNGHLFTCYQRDIDPCMWDNDPEFSGWKVTVSYACNQNQTRIYLKDADNHSYFFGSVGGFAAEHSVIGNQYGGCAPGQNSYDGVASPFWLVAVWLIVEALNLPTDGGLFLEYFLIDESRPVLKFCNTKYGINQTIEIT